MNCDQCANFKLKEEIILVPETIQFVKREGDIGMGLLFNNNNQKIYLDLYEKEYEVKAKPRTLSIPTKLILCKKEDIGLGEWGFWAYQDMNGASTRNMILPCKRNYCLNIGDGEFAYIYEDL